MATVVQKTNSNFEKIGSIKVLSSSGISNRSELQGVIFGGYGYSAEVNANEGAGYSITIRVISSNGEYSISRNNLDATAGGAKNIEIGNFTFFDFFLVSYKIERQVESSILILNYKDKSIFMDKLYIGLLNYDYGVKLVKIGQPEITQEELPTNVVNLPQVATFDFYCDQNNATASSVLLTRNLNTVNTIRPKFSNADLNKLKAAPNMEKIVNSSFFHSKYNYETDGVNGGYIILGSEEFKEQNCALPDVSYSFRDLLSSLHYSKVPGIIELNLPDNPIYINLRKNYNGSLRNVLNQWASDLGLTFYFQPKIRYYKRDYSDLTKAPEGPYEIKPELKYLDLNSSAQTLKNLTDFFNSSQAKALKKVIQNLSEEATLEGTEKSSVITAIRRESRTFPRTSDSVNYFQSSPLGLQNIPPLFGVNPTTDDFLIRAVLGKYDAELRDIYALNVLGTQNIASLAMQIIENVSANQSLVDNLDFRALFGPEYTGSEILSRFNIYLAYYNPEKHDLIKKWEQDIINNFYNQYYKMESGFKDQTYCGATENYAIRFRTEPPSQRYSANELPFKNLLYSQSDLTKLNLNQKTDPLFKVDNPFFDANETRFNNFISSYATGDESKYSEKKKIILINFSQNAIAQTAFLKCVKNNLFKPYKDYTDNENCYLILAPKLSTPESLNLTVIIDPPPPPSGYFINSSVLTIDDLKKIQSSANNNPVCQPTICEQNAASFICGDNNTENNSANTGFIAKKSRAIRLTANGQSFDLLLPTYSNYQYAITQTVNATTTIPAKSYILGNPPSASKVKKENNVLSYSVLANTPPEMLTQSVPAGGVQANIVTYDDTKAIGKRTVITDALTYHEIANKELNSSVLEPQESRSFSIVSTYIPNQLESYIFNNPVLSSMSFNLSNDGFNMTFNFQSRPRSRKAKDSVFITEQFLKIL